jgi:Pyruvate/2-oxoacid:ferredoxin oxidoreductase delta subunit
VQADYQATFVGGGVQRSSHEGLSATAFMHLINRGERFDFGPKLSVRGQGLLAIEVAHICERLGKEIVDEGADTIIDCAAMEPQHYGPEALRSGKGRIAAEDIIARLTGVPSTHAPVPPMMAPGKMKLDWYPASPRAGQVLTEAEVFEEAKRCMSCGICMDCETCWMYCTNNCFVKLSKGDHYKLKLEVCNGCRKCAEACPCGYIEMI